MADDAGSPTTPAVSSRDAAATVTTMRARRDDGASGPEVRLTRRGRPVRRVEVIEWFRFVVTASSPAGRAGVAVQDTVSPTPGPVQRRGRDAAGRSTDGRPRTLKNDLKLAVESVIAGQPRRSGERVARPRQGTRRRAQHPPSPSFCFSPRSSVCSVIGCYDVLGHGPIV
ncbi:hypothetical protein FRIGORI9N_40021 [Frigoribacterium sp. 9N]|nr:hypothetical protein FRIGORI9N_40021 [Frigoribacterium sp. 9N]